MVDKMWDWREISRLFLKRAAQADTALWDMRRAARHGAISQEKYDQILAEYTLFHSLWGQPFLQTNLRLLQELQSLFAEPVAEDKAFDKNRYLTQYRNSLSALMRDIHSGKMAREAYEIDF